MLLVDQNRMGYLPQIRDALRELVEQAAGRVTAQLISARPLAQDEVERLREVLSRRVNAEVELQLEVDESLIGGVIARVGDLMLDGSVRTQLDSLSMNLRRGSP
jgi:F-type H+-transporting ATPase subunit delta